MDVINALRKTIKVIEKSPKASREVIYEHVASKAKLDTYKNYVTPWRAYKCMHTMKEKASTSIPALSEIIEQNLARVKPLPSSLKTIRLTRDADMKLRTSSPMEGLRKGLIQNKIQRLLSDEASLGSLNTEAMQARFAEHLELKPELPMTSVKLTTEQQLRLNQLSNEHQVPLYIVLSEIILNGS